MAKLWPPKIPTFSGRDSVRLYRGPQYSACWRNFEKSFRIIVVLRPATITVYSLTSCVNNRSTSTKKQKSAVLLILAPFTTKWLGHRRHLDEMWAHYVVHNNDILAVHRNIKKMQWAWEQFWKVLEHVLPGGSGFCAALRQQELGGLPRNDA